MDYVECMYCGHRTIKSRLGRHLDFHHQKTIRENTLKRLGLSEEQIPVCKYCNAAPVEVDFDLKPTCGSEKCHQMWFKERRLEIAKLGAATQIARGIHPFTKENLKRDNNGKSVMHCNSAHKANKTRAKQGTHPFQHQNLELDENGKSTLHIKGQLNRVQNGNHPWSKENLKRDDEGKSIMHKIIGKKANATSLQRGTNNLLGQNLVLDESGKSIMHKKIAATRNAQGTLHGHRIHNNEFNAEFVREHFVSEGQFQLEECCEYFNITEHFVNTFKRKNHIIEPNKLISQQRQQQIYQYLRSHTNKEVLLNDRTVIGPKELDIVVPSVHIAVEFDGLNYHATGINALGQKRVVPVEYHLTKTETAERAGYRLFHIFENEWLDEHKQMIWKEMLHQSISSSPLLSAKECRLAEIDRYTAASFLDRYHLMGSVPATIYLGLKRGSEIMALMAFTQTDHYTELVRYCTKSSCLITEGANILLQAYRNRIFNKSIVTYVNRRIDNGELFETLGFRLIETLPPAAFYFKPDNKLELISEPSAKLLIEHSKADYDPRLSITDNMLQHGYMVIYDCGSLKYTLD